MLYFWKGNGTRTSKTKLPFVWHANTNTQKHKYTNTALVTVTDMPNICYIFRKEMVRGHQKQCSQLSDMQIKIHKNTNTHIHKYTNTDSVKVPNRPNMAYIFWKGNGTYSTLKTMFPNVWRSNTQIFVVQDSHSSTGSSW